MSKGMNRIHALKNKNDSYLSDKENFMFVIKDGIMQCRSVDLSYWPVK